MQRRPDALIDLTRFICTARRLACNLCECLGVLQQKKVLAGC